MSGTIRSRMEAIRAIVNDKQISTYAALEMIDKLADDTLTDLNNAPKCMWEDRYAGRWIDDPSWVNEPPTGHLIPDPKEDNGS